MKYFLKITFLLTFLFVCHFALPSNSQNINKIIDDFTDNPEMRWQFYTDQVMGGVSEGGASVRIDSEGPYVRLEGLVSTANNGGFIQIRRNVSKGSKSAEGILLKVRGNGENYYIHVNTSETIFLPQQYRFYYQAKFPTSKEWNEIKLPFSTAFKRSNSQISKYFTGENVRTVGLLAYGKDHNALLEVKYLSFYHTTPVTPPKNPSYLDTNFKKISNDAKEIN